MYRFESNKPTVPNWSAGFSLIEQLVVLSIVGIIAGGIAGVLPKILAAQQNSSRIANMYSLRNKIINVLRNSRAWEATRADVSANNTAFTCWNDSPSDCSGLLTPTVTPISFTPIESDGTMMFDDPIVPGSGFNPRNVPNHGFDFEGNLCSTYNAGIPDATCPVRVDLTWLPICPASLLCSKPAIVVQMRFTIQFTDELGLVFNNDQLDRIIYVAGDSKIGQARRCQDYPGKGYTDEFVVTGVDADGELICTHADTIFGQEPL